MRIVDLNVLLYAVNADATQHAAVHAWWVAAMNGEDTIGLPWVVLLGFLDDHWRTLKSLLDVTGTAGNLTTDAHLAALALTHDAVLVSCDTDFARFRDLRWENPLG